MKEFYEKTKSKSPDERAILLEKDDKIEEAHQESSKPDEGKDDQVDMDTNLHFVCFVHHEGTLFELDGRRKYPQPRGKTSTNTLLKVI